MQKTNLREIDMHIDYYCFPTQTGDLSVFTDLDQYTNARMKAHYERALKHVLLAKEKGKLLLFDLRDNHFVDENGEDVNIEGKVIFPRSTILQADVLVSNIEKAHGISITSQEDFAIVENWFKIVPTKRSYSLTTMEELELTLDDFEELYGIKFFVKTVHKRFSGVCFITEMTFHKNSPTSKYLFDSHFHSLNMSINSDSEVLVYKCVNIVKDEHGKREWRAFVVNNQLLSLSRASDDVVPVEEYVFKKVEEKIRELTGVMPSSYVIDFFEYEEDNSIIFDIVECNPIIASGTFANNDLVF